MPSPAITSYVLLNKLESLYKFCRLWQCGVAVWGPLWLFLITSTFAPISNLLDRIERRHKGILLSPAFTSKEFLFINLCFSLSNWWNIISFVFIFYKSLVECVVFVKENDSGNSGYLTLALILRSEIQICACPQGWVVNGDSVLVYAYVSLYLAVVSCFITLRQPDCYSLQYISPKHWIMLTFSFMYLRLNQKRDASPTQLPTHLVPIVRMTGSCQDICSSVTGECGWSVCYVSWYFFL